MSRFAVQSGSPSPDGARQIKEVFMKKNSSFTLIGAIRLFVSFCLALAAAACSMFSDSGGGASVSSRYCRCFFPAPFSMTL
jgi:hypothetical protein